MNKYDNESVHTLLKIIYKVMEMEEEIQYYGTDVKISISEIHVLDVIFNNPGIHISGIAKKRGVTRGAISQLIKKMGKKGLVSKSPDPANLSRTVINLTKKGVIAQRVHLDFHDLFNKEINKSLKSLSTSERNAIDEFLNEVLKTTLTIESVVKKW